jgi:hypothetical protein
MHARVYFCAQSTTALHLVGTFCKANWGHFYLRQRATVLCASATISSVLLPRTWAARVEHRRTECVQHILAHTLYVRW